MARDETAIIQMFNSYIEAFQTLDPQAIAPYCHVPCLLVSSRGALAMTSRAEVEGLFSRMAEDLKARSYGRSEIDRVQLSQMSDDIVVVSADTVRYKADGDVLERFGATYTLYRSDEGWKIATAALHAPGAILGLA